MIADIISASHGSPCWEIDQPLLAVFDSLEDALTAAKRIQYSVLEFAARRTGTCGGSAILMCGPEQLPCLDEQTSSEARYHLDLLQEAKPGAILVSEDLGKQLRDLPGIEFRRFRPGIPSDKAIYELIWTTPETYARWSELADQIPRGGQDQPLGATQVLSPPPTPGMDVAQYLSRPDQASESSSWGPRLVRPSNPPQASVPEPRSENESAAEPGAELPAPEWLEPGTFLDQELTPRRDTMKWATAAIVVLGALLAVLLLNYHGRRPPGTQPVDSQQPSPSNPTPGDSGAGSQPSTGTTPDAGAPDAGQQTPTATAPSKTPEPATSDEVKEQQKTERAPAPASNRRSDKQAGSEAPESVDGFFPRQIPDLLQKADDDIGNGKYREARREYGIVLRLDPNNARARRGLRKIELSEKESGPQD